MDKSDIISFKFNGTNYFSWEFQFHNYVQGQELWGSVDGTVKKPSSADTDNLDKWTTKNVRIISWILNSVELSIALNLRPYPTATEMWDYLSKIYHQQNDARQFHLEYEIAECSQGGTYDQELLFWFYDTGLIMLLLLQLQSLPALLT